MGKGEGWGEGSGDGGGQSGNDWDHGLLGCCKSPLHCKLKNVSTVFARIIVR